jgi:hypothetical protein
VATSHRTAHRFYELAPRARYDIALEYIRLRDVIRTFVRAGLEPPLVHMTGVADLDRLLAR